MWTLILSPNHKISQALTSTLPARWSWGSTLHASQQLFAVVSDDDILIYKYVNIIWHTTYSSKTIWSMFTDKMVKNNCAIWFAFCPNLSTLMIHHRWGPTGQIPKCCQLQHCRSAGYENQALDDWQLIFLPSSMEAASLKKTTNTETNARTPSKYT